MIKDKILELLDIDEIIDVKQIKIAYAKKSKEIHPEEKPIEFSELHEAYKQALIIAKNDFSNKFFFVQNEIEDRGVSLDKINEFDVQRIIEQMDEQYDKSKEEFFSNLKKKKYNNVENKDNIWKEMFDSKYFWSNMDDDCFIDEFLNHLIEFDKIDIHILQQLYEIYGFTNKKVIEYYSDENRLFLFLSYHMKFGFPVKQQNKNKIKKINSEEFHQYIKFFEKFNYKKAVVALQQKKGELYMVGYKQYQYFLNDCVYLIGNFSSYSDIRMVLRHYPKKLSYKKVKYYIENEVIRKIMYKSRYKRKQGYYFVILSNFFFFEPETEKQSFEEKVKILLKKVRAK